MTKQELIKIGAHYFDKKDVKVMYATEDGNFFYEESKNFGDSHAKTKNIELFIITRADLSKKKEVKKENVKAEIKEEVKEEVKEKVKEKEAEKMPVWTPKKQSKKK